MTRTWLRTLFGVLAVFAVMAIAVACGDDDDDDDTGGTSASPAATTGSSGSPAAQNTTPSGTITIAALQFETWDPHFSDFAQDIAHFMMVWRGMYELDLQNKPQPSMAEGAPQVSSDGKTYTIKLKSGLKWSDGQPLDANDFVMGIQRTCDWSIGGHYQYILTGIVGCDAAYDAKNKDKTPAEQETLRKAVGVRAVDALTVEIKLAQPQPTFPILLSMWPTFPVPKHLVKTVDAKWPAPLEAVYNGPFMPSKYTEKSSLELVPNPNWVGKEKAKVEKIVLKYIDDAAVAMQAYRAGEIDATVLPPAEITAVKADSTLSKELLQFPATRTFGLAFNHKAGSVGEKLEVRLAFSQATDRAAMNKVVFKDVQTPTTNWMPPDRSGLKLGTFDSAIGFDAAKAKANLAKAGFADGKGFPELTLLLTETATNKDLGAFLQSEWKKHLNVDVKLEFVDSKTRSARYNAKDFQVVIAGWQEDYPDPENWYIGLRETNGSINKEGCSLPALDKAIGDAKFNTNDEARRQLYRDAEKLAIENIQCNAPLWHVQALRMIKPYIKGMAENKRPGDTFVAGDWNPELWTTTKK